jgi:hypothetical protein
MVDFKAIGLRNRFAIYIDLEQYTENDLGCKRDQEYSPIQTWMSTDYASDLDEKPGGNTSVELRGQI